MNRKYSYRRTLPHVLKDNRPVFVTFTTCKRWRLPEQCRALVLASCVKQHGCKIELHAAVVMPDHVHLIFTPKRDAEGWLFTLPAIMHAIKGASAHEINKALNRKGPVWQDEFFDHVLRNNESLNEKVSYICQNPIRAGLAIVESEYPWLWRGDVPVI